MLFQPQNCKNELHLILKTENKDDLERTQKSFAKMVLKDEYIDYENAKIILNLDSLKERRHILCLKFAKKWNKQAHMCIAA